MLLVPQERETIVREKVGIVFLTTGEEVPADVLRLLLGKWRDLEILDSTEPRPFARFLSPPWAVNSCLQALPTIGLAAH